MSDSPKRVAIKTLGCKVNRTESEALAEALLGAGVQMVDEPSDADVVIVNTCSVTGESDAKARKEIRRALAATDGPVLVAGCLARLDPDGLRTLGDRVRVEGDRTNLNRTAAELVGADLAQERAHASAAVRASSSAELFRTRVMVKVQDGCDHRCSYCIVPDARGAPVSIPASEIAARVRDLAAEGTPEIVLTGINIGRYSDTAAGVTDFAGLLRLIASTADRFRIRVSSIEPLDLTERLADAVACLGDRVAPHLHVPLQSGCDRTLLEMRRGYTAGDFAALLARVRDVRPELAVTTDVIVGFPGETEADHAESLAFVERCGFARLHVFRYSRRTGTPAGNRSDQVPAPVSIARAAAMRQLSDRLEAAWKQRRDGGNATVLVERVAQSEATGTTEDGMRVALPRASAHAGEMVEVRLDLDDEGRMHGIPRA